MNKAVYMCLIHNGHVAGKIMGNITAVALKKMVGDVFPPSVRLTWSTGEKISYVSSRNEKP